MTDQEKENLADVTEQGVVSNCCGAPVIMTDICSECMEHCDPITEGSDDE